MKDINNVDSKNLALRRSFSSYCFKHPELRFWQALCNWANVGSIAAIEDTYDKPKIRDTFYWEGKNE